MPNAAECRHVKRRAHDDYYIIILIDFIWEMKWVRPATHSEKINRKRQGPCAGMKDTKRQEKGEDMVANV